MNYKQIHLALCSLGLLLFALSALANKNINHPKDVFKTSRIMAEGCSPATAQTSLDINNVRTNIMNGGDMWWDLSALPKYEVPKGSDRHSLFAGALWIGGIDAGGQLKVAAMTYRQTGSDFFPGPVDKNTSITKTECVKYDKIWKLTREQVQEFVDWWKCKSTPGCTPTPGYTPPLSITTWPSIAPFNDVNGDGVYDPLGAGDYPNYDLTGDASCTSCGNPTYKDLLFGDQTLWWVFNDVGNIHGETRGEPIGLEIQAQAFAFATNDEINNMTFYKYKIINRSSYQVNDTYFGQWVDPDLGGAVDDYVGCDVGRGLGYCYNGTAVDNNCCGGELGYGANPPAVGVDFFQGPLADPGDGVDNNRNCLVDEPCEQIIMSKFVYYNNDFSLVGNPETATHFYNYLQGKWKDGQKMTYGGSGRLTGSTCDFMFPDKSDHKYEWGTGGNCVKPASPQADWNEVTAGNAPADRRFIQSAGKFTLTPGAVNYITVGAVWARASQGGNLASLELLKIADDKAQALFDNCFRVMNGPDAPDLSIRELDKELILSITNKTSSNNYNELYKEIDPTIVAPPGVTYDNTYRFQGYQIFQLKDATITATDIHDPNKARLVAQCDIKDGIKQLVNYKYDMTLGASVATEEVKGSDTGIVHSFNVTQDLFAVGNTRLINHKPYYFTAIAYSYNEFKKYKQDQAPDTSNVNVPAYDGQKTPYFAGRRNVNTYSGIPHIPDPNNYGQMLNSVYGSGPSITRIEGQGNGGLVLDLTQSTINDILSNPMARAEHPTYQNGRGPVSIKVYDPVKVPKADFKLVFLDATQTKDTLKNATWTLTNLNTNSSVSSDQTIRIFNEQIIPKWGLSVSIIQTDNPGDDPVNGNGFLESTMSFSDISQAWLSGVPDISNAGALNWIRSGTSCTPMQESKGMSCQGGKGSSTDALDPQQFYEKIIGGTWAPYCLTANNIDPTFLSPGWKFQEDNKLQNLPSVDVVITSDKSKWTRSVVIEMSEDAVLSEGGARKFDQRRGQSVDKNGSSDGTGTGMGWFPGYAINVETGERLNIVFGEDSWLTGENGRDMKWNPTSSFSTPIGQMLFGGKHYLYIMNSRYDEGAQYNSLFKMNNGVPDDNTKRLVYADAAWVTLPLLMTNRTLLASDVKVRLRVSKSYNRFVSANNSIIRGGATSTSLNAGNYLVIDGVIRVIANGKSKWYQPGDTLLISSSVVFQSKNQLGVNTNGKVMSISTTAMPQYTFSTNDLANESNNTDAAKSALDLINVVPNPYYAYSDYEKNQLDNRIKITNLPSKCTVSIYTVHGTLIRTFNRDISPDVSDGTVAGAVNLETSLEWDMKNSVGVPVASGLYLIHVNVPNVGERILKWFGIMRPADLNLN